MDTKCGPQNTEATLKQAFDYAVNQNLSTVVVASTSGETGVLACNLRPKSVSNLIIVSHNTGFRSNGVQQMAPELRQEIKSAGATIHTGTLVLRGIGSAIRNKLHYSEEQLVAETLRLFGQGIKVCAEMAAMTSDAGLIGNKDCVFIAGTSRGADTAVHISPAPSNDFFKLKIRHIICKPFAF
ncbi:MAG: hypothetical protein JXR76_12825 [Deltaproteobacteria bacterium]|nr:hypothetical protein [Deltaproteobacteria bacterium]